MAMPSTPRSGSSRLYAAAPRTHAECDVIVQGLWNVGGAYRELAYWFEHDNRPHMPSEREPRLDFPPWRA